MSASSFVGTAPKTQGNLSHRDAVRQKLCLSTEDAMISELLRAGLGVKPTHFLRNIAAVSNGGVFQAPPIRKSTSERSPPLPTRRGASISGVERTSDLSATVAVFLAIPRIFHGVACLKSAYIDKNLVLFPSGIPRRYALLSRSLTVLWSSPTDVPVCW